MATNNAVNTSLSGQTGTGAFVGATSPALVTPALGTPASGTLTNCTGLPASSGISGLGTGVATALGNNVTGSGGIALATSPSLTTPNLGAATATSINFGGSTLSTYASQSTWTPGFTFATPGDLSVVYNSRAGYYTQIGAMIFYYGTVNFTPTFTTASGSCQITGLPVTVSASLAQNYPNFITLNSTGWTWPASRTCPVGLPLNNTTNILIQCQGSNLAEASLTTANVVSGVAIACVVNGFYFV